MSMDLAVYVKEKAPEDPVDFLEWFWKKTEWNGERDYYDILGTDERLAAFFLEMIKTFPAMNGKYAPTEEELQANPELEDSPMVTEYNIDEDLIYMGFAYSVSDQADELIRKLAVQNGLGYFDMVNMYPDENSRISVPQLSYTEWSKGEKTARQLYEESLNPPKKSFLSKLFGKK